MRIDPTDGEIVLGPFCVNGPGVFEFFFNATIDREAMDVEARLRVDSTTVAKANTGASNFPANLSLFYRARITGETEVELIIDDGVLGDAAAFRIANRELQWGYKLYDSSYPLLTTIPADCPDPP